MKNKIVTGIVIIIVVIVAAYFFMGDKSVVSTSDISQTAAVGASSSDEVSDIEADLNMAGPELDLSGLE